MIIVFDAKCLVCSSWVQFLLKHDQQRVFRFVSIQSRAGMDLLARAGLNITTLETLLLVDGERHYRHTAAILRVLHQLGYPWKLAWIVWLVPSFIRDAAYRWVARNRYRIFGRSDACFLPNAEHRLRFMEDTAEHR
ncbi:thiol-disulfide oxidoreductase DCC family protein [Collimonas silvisoli]|uniref:thiol-disulfide oxidoreductase DCC family protein n=1 Tax=Collimonas silvisoli TaxID=2825884 RepID=UPI001B8B00A6|nr:DCC1-like thiol-disulfide oxidoreductase family protein [Collimonas silvisoli]